MSPVRGVLAQLAGGKIDLDLSGQISLGETQTRTSANPASTEVESEDFPVVESDFYFVDASILYNLI